MEDGNLSNIVEQMDQLDLKVHHEDLMKIHHPSNHKDYHKNVQYLFCYCSNFQTRRCMMCICKELHLREKAQLIFADLGRFF